MSEVWTRDSAVLRAVAQLCITTGGGLEPQQVLELLPEEQWTSAPGSLYRLSQTGHIDALTAQSSGERVPQVIMIKGVTEKGLRESGVWPANAEQAAQALLAALDEAADNASDAEERSKLKAFGSAFLALGTNAGGGVLAAAFAKLMGLG